MRNFTRVASDPLFCLSAERSANAMANTNNNTTSSSSGASIRDSSKVQNTMSLKKLSQSTELNLLQVALSEPLAAMINETLDELCPALSSTPLVQQKALRIVFSVGIDVMLVDAESSAYLGKFNIAPKDLINSSQSEKIFGSFCIPSQ